MISIDDDLEHRHSTHRRLCRHTTRVQAVRNEVKLLQVVEINNLRQAGRCSMNGSAALSRTQREGEKVLLKVRIPLRLQLVEEEEAAAIGKKHLAHLPPCFEGFQWDKVGRSHQAALN